MNILVLGGMGFLGSNLVRHCLRRGRDHRVTVVDSLEPRLRSRPETLRDVRRRFHFVRGDMRDERLMAEVVARQDVIFNCAAQTSHPLSLRDPLFDAQVNCLGNLVVLEAVRRHNPQAVVVYPSSSTVVGRAVSPVIDETHMERPLDIYSANKGVAEKYHLIYHAAHDLKTVVLRFANLYGPYGKGHPDFGFINYFIHLAHRGQDITVYGSGGQLRNVMFVEDAAEALYRSALEPALRGQALFAAHDEHLSVGDIAREIVRVFGRGRVVSVGWPDMRQRMEVDDVRISSARLRELTGWAPRHSFAEGLEVTRRVMERKDYHAELDGDRGARAYRLPLHPGVAAPAGAPGLPA